MNVQDTSGGSGGDRAGRDGWGGESGRHWVEHEERHDTMLAALTGRLMAAADIGPADAVLDIGCGCGRTTRLAARDAHRGQALGVDISSPMLAAARDRTRGEGVRNVRFELADAQTHPFPEGGFDVALSRFGVMFFDDPEAAFGNIARALRPGGRMAFLCWQEVTRNEHLMVPFGAIAAFAPPPDLGAPGVSGPFSLADPDLTRGLLERSGFCRVGIEPVTERLRVGSDIEDVVSYLRGHPVARGMFASVDDEKREAALAAVRSALEPYETPDGVMLGSAAWLVTAHRDA